MGIFSFPYEERVKKEEEFSKIIKEGRAYALLPIVLYVRKKGKRKIGISVSRKIKSAVVRNRLKRLVREVYRLNRPYIAEDTEMVVIIRPEGKDIKNFREMEEILKKLWQDAKVLKNDKKNSSSPNKIL